MLKQHPADAHIDARDRARRPGVGARRRAGGDGGELRHAHPDLAAIAQLTGFINLFNLIPVWQLDGSRGFHALSRQQRWAVIGAIAIAFLLTNQRMLLIIGLVAVWRAVEREQGPGDNKAFATYVALIGALSWLSHAIA